MMPLLPAFTGAPEVNKVYNVDLFDLCAAMSDASVDMILCDLPYGTTVCAWDTVIPFEPMWKAFKRIIKPRGAIVLTASQPFTSALVMSNPKMFRYAWVWAKTIGTNPMLTTWQPFKKHEDVLVFSLSMPVFYPQFEVGAAYTDRARNSGLKALHSKAGMKKAINNPGIRCPSSVQVFPNPNNDTVHPTQKPVDLFRYLIRTYTQPNELVFDPCVGSGTTAVAAREEGRSFIVGDSSLEYVEIARARLAAPYTPSFMPQLDLTA